MDGIFIKVVRNDAFLLQIEGTFDDTPFLFKMRQKQLYWTMHLGMDPGNYPIFSIEAKHGRYGPVCLTMEQAQAIIHQTYQFWKLHLSQQ